MAPWLATNYRRIPGQLLIIISTYNLDVSEEQRTATGQQQQQMMIKMNDDDDEPDYKLLGGPLQRMLWLNKRHPYNNCQFGHCICFAGLLFLRRAQPNRQTDRWDTFAHPIVCWLIEFWPAVNTILGSIPILCEHLRNLLMKGTTLWTAHNHRLIWGKPHSKSHSWASKRGRV